MGSGKAIPHDRLLAAVDAVLHAHGRGMSGEALYLTLCPPFNELEIHEAEMMVTRLGLNKQNAARKGNKP